MSFDLTKRIERGTWRWIGERVHGLSTLDVPIGGSSLRAILRHTGGTPHRIGRINPMNAFVIDRPPLRLLYVRPRYGGYRYAAGKVFRQKDWKVDYDHALGRAIAESLGFCYVLLIRIPPNVNRGHGRFERPRPVTGPSLQKLCFADSRILDKWIGRPPNRMGDPERLRPYVARRHPALGLTLKQAGKWGYAMGVEDDPLPLDHLRAFESKPVRG